MYKGVIEQVSPIQVSGQCKYTDGRTDPIELQLFIDDKQRGTAQTNVINQGMANPERTHHFSFTLATPINPAKASIRVSPTHSTYTLPFSGEIKSGLLRMEPRPLIFPEKKLALLWSAKSGCTFALKWFFFQMNLLDEALRYDNWIHNYRQLVYVNSNEYNEHIQDILENTGYTLFKVVRDPFTRTVSSYIHAIRTGYADQELTVFLRRPVQKDSSSFTFREFMDFLGAIDLDFCDIHHKVQVHLIERLGMVPRPTIIKLESIRTSLETIELQHNLRRSSYDALRASEHHSNYTTSHGFCGDHQFDSSTREFPGYRSFYDNNIVGQVTGLYEEDFEAYDYPLTLHL